MRIDTEQNGVVRAGVVAGLNNIEQEHILSSRSGESSNGFGFVVCSSLHYPERRFCVLAPTTYSGIRSAFPGLITPRALEAESVLKKRVFARVRSSLSDRKLTLARIRHSFSEPSRFSQILNLVLNFKLKEQYRYKSMNEIWRNLLLKLFLWSGSKLFNAVAIYPSGADYIEAVHFGVCEQAIAKSLTEFAEESLK